MINGVIVVGLLSRRGTTYFFPSQRRTRVRIVAITNIAWDFCEKSVRDTAQCIISCEIIVETNRQGAKSAKEVKEGFYEPFRTAI